MLPINVYDVALWRYWPSEAFPIVAFIPARSAFAAIECCMQRYRLFSVAYAAAANTQDHRVKYRAYGVRRKREEELCQ